MMRLICIVSLFVYGVVGASTPSMTFPYGVDMSVRHQVENPMEFDGTYHVPSVGGGMPTSDTVVTTYTEVFDLPAANDEVWSSLADSAANCQAALTLREKEDGKIVWMGVSGDGWVELQGVDAIPGAWVLRIDLDYTQGKSGSKVRYSVKAEGFDDYVVLVPAAGDSGWLPNGKSGVFRMEDLKLCGVGEVVSAKAESGQRQGYAETETVENYRMDYSGMVLDVAVGETWGVDTLVATVKDVAGNEKGEVRVALADAKDGKIGIDLSKYVKAGESYVYDLKLTGEYNDTPMACERGGGKVDLFSNVDWFGFDGARPVKAEVQGLTVVDGILSATDPSGKGALIPEFPETKSSPTTVELSMAVPGAVPHWDLLTLPVSGSQGALVMVQYGGSVGRSWAVWSATANTWVAVDGAGIATENGTYDVRAEFDEIASTRSVRYSVKVGSDYVVLKDSRLEEWFALPTSALTLNKLTLSGAGGISGANATYKALGPIGEVVVEGNEIVLKANTVISLAQGSFVPDQGYRVQNSTGKTYHVSWTDSANRYAVMSEGTLTVKEGQPANGMDSYESYVFGLDPTDSTAKPYMASVHTDNPNEFTFTLPNINPKSESETGVAVSYDLIASTDPSFPDGKKAVVATATEKQLSCVLPSDKVTYYKIEINMK